MKKLWLLHLHEAQNLMSPATVGAHEYLYLLPTSTETLGMTNTSQVESRALRIIVTQFRPTTNEQNQIYILIHRADEMIAQRVMIIWTKIATFKQKAHTDLTTTVTFEL